MRVLCRLLSLLLLPVLFLPARADRRVSEEAGIFHKYRGGVVRVEADDGTGSGFLVDSAGILLTNEHVVGHSTRLRVWFADSIRVEARLLASDAARDVAALRVARSFVRSIPTLPLAVPSDTMVIEGERVLAIGSPLGRDVLMTAGIVSRVEPSALISDVNINPGNSGGPLLNLAGQVVAVNTFTVQADRGPGVSGSLPIGLALPVLAAARESLATGAEPSTRPLATPPRGSVPVDSMIFQIPWEQFDTDPYEVSHLTHTGKFVVRVYTPELRAWVRHARASYAREQRKGREEKGHGGGASSGSEDEPEREWQRAYGGNSRTPVVTLMVVPMAEQGHFLADFGDITLTVHGVEVEDCGRTRVAVSMGDLHPEWPEYAAADNAHIGYFTCTPDWFRPTGEEPAHIHVRLASVESPDQPVEFDLPARTAKRVWDDFAAWRATQAPPAAPADPAPPGVGAK